MIREATRKLSPGSRLGHYEIVDWLGAGGMGEVYRGRDPRLDREVAIKVIAEAFAADPSRLRRFEDEARAAGRLNHPNILTVYDVGSEAGVPFIVSELLEGESLRRLLQRDTLLPQKAIDYARQAAVGLAAAHDKGIVHRDVKPDNVFITSDGRVKLLDFGVAKLMQPDGHPALSSDRTQTVDGVVIGTASYMSPEQVRGEPVDGRSDIFSVGAILFEMLGGGPAFTRGTAADTMAAVLKDTASLGTIVDAQLERVVARCLEKPRESRFQSAHDLAFALEGLLGSTSSTSIRRAGVRWSRQTRWRWAAGAVLAAAAVLPIAWWAPWREPPLAAPIVLSAQLGADVSIADSISTAFGQTMTVSPKGDVIAFQARTGARGLRQLHLLRLDQKQAVPLPGTEDAVSPFFSPDGRWIGFFADGQLKKVAVTGGTPESLAPAPNTRGGAWSGDNVIVYAPDKESGTRLMRISASGGGAAPLASLAEGERIQAWPQFLPGGTGVLYTGSTVPGAYNDANLMVQPLPSGPPKIVYRGGYHGRYVASGHLIFIHDGTLFAAPFDLGRMQVGQRVRVRESVVSNAVTGGAQFSVSESGTLIYRPGPAAGADIQLHWMQRDGTTTPLPIQPKNLLNLSFSRDGRLALEVREGPPNIWIHDGTGDALRRLTSDPIRAVNPIWTPAGDRVTFASARGDKSTLNLWWQRADGAEAASRLTDSRNPQKPGSWHRDGRFLAFEEQTAQSGSDVMLLEIEGNDIAGWKPRSVRPLLDTPAVERDPNFSPDGRWLAYSSDESGRFEVYVQPFPGPGAAVPISAEGGGSPTWSRTRREIYYGSNGRVMAVPYTVEGGAFRPTTPQRWSEGHYQVRGPNRMFDLHPDGERFALAPATNKPDEHLTFFFNFLEELRRLAPADKD